MKTYQVIGKRACGEIRYLNTGLSLSEARADLRRKRAWIEGNGWLTSPMKRSPKYVAGFRSQVEWKGKIPILVTTEYTIEPESK